MVLATMIPVRDAMAASAGDISKRMAANRSRDTRPELAVRRGLHRLGLRYRVAYAPVPGSRRTADIVFTKAKIAIMIDGCFWHACPDHYRPATGPRRATWDDKIARNIQRDRETTHLLQDHGWTVLRFWEHEPSGSVVDAIRAALTTPDSRPARTPP
jgi:DNA mismatch endonuclease (patch repair protein)